MAPDDAGPMLNRREKRSLQWTLGLTLFSVATAIAAFLTQNWATFAASLGALGGLVHEFAQSQGKILFFEKHSDGLYMGSITGMVLGAVAGALAVQGSVVGSARDSIDPHLVGYQGFFAGLALKGITEAATGNAPKRSEDP
jgi:hypothetical protein